MPTITIQGLKFEVPEPYTAGHVLLENEASALNQTFAENIRNNCARSIVEPAQEEAEANGTELDLEALQAAINEYASSYQFGVRTGGGRTTDPVERAAMEIARAAIFSAMAKKGIARTSVKAAQVTELAKNYLESEAGKGIYEEARRQVAAAKDLEVGAIDLESLV